MSVTAILSTESQMFFQFQRQLPLEALLLDASGMEQVIQRYHFPKEERDGFLELQKEVCENWEGKGIVLSLPKDMQQIPATYGSLVLRHWDTMLGAITLGRAYDQLQQKYSQRQQVGQAYRLEILGMEYLRRSYGWFNEAVSREGRGFPGEYHYLETAQEIRQACAFLQKNQFAEISCNAYGVLSPSKSVVFRTELGVQKRKACRSSCASCRAQHCSFRQNE